MADSQSPRKGVFVMAALAVLALTAVVYVSNDVHEAPVELRDVDFEAKDFVEPWKRPTGAMLSQEPAKPPHAQLKIAKDTTQLPAVAGKRAGKTIRPPRMSAQSLVAPVGVSGGFNKWLDRLPFGNEYQKRLEKAKEQKERLAYQQKHDPSYLLLKAGSLNEMLVHRVNFLKRMLAARLGAPSGVVVNIKRPGLPGDRGPTGTRGLVGKQGPVGQLGPRGLPGNPGQGGPPGPAGHTGPQGDTGLAGPPGDNGRAGSIGRPGYAGRRGIRGRRGPTPNRGRRGRRGTRGRPGRPGIRGYPGNRGIRGPRGPPGPNRRVH